MLKILLPLPAQEQAGAGGFFSTRHAVESEGEYGEATECLSGSFLISIAFSCG